MIWPVQNFFNSGLIRPVFLFSYSKGIVPKRSLKFFQNVIFK